MEQDCIIYALRDPRDREIRYVGQSMRGLERAALECRVDKSAIYKMLAGSQQAVKGLKFQKVERNQ